MPAKKKGSDQGWFYHAPPKPNPRLEPLDVPPASQIPGLSDLPPAQVDEGQRGWIKETDTPYIILAKRGGREDLLAIKEPKPAPQEAVGYPRVDWFYLEDNRIEDESKSQSGQGAHSEVPYQPRLPEYMVHEEFDRNGDGDGGFSKPKRAPYSFDSQTVFEREPGRLAADKNVKLPEIKRLGYGVRQDKLKDKNVKHNVPKPERAKPPQEQLTQTRNVNHMPEANEEEKAIMGKILSFGYARDWEEAREKWAKDKQEKQQTNRLRDAAGPPKFQGATEYQQGFTNKSAGKKSLSPRHAAPAHKDKGVK